MSFTFVCLFVTSHIKHDFQTSYKSAMTETSSQMHQFFFSMALMIGLTKVCCAWPITLRQGISNNNNNNNNNDNNNNNNNKNDDNNTDNNNDDVLSVIVNILDKIQEIAILAVSLCWICFGFATALSSPHLSCM